jgi:hypothetical protein
MGDNQPIIVFVSGGVVQDVSFPAGCQTAVSVHDYDVDGAADPGLSHDGQGEPFLEALWEPPPQTGGGP